MDELFLHLKFIAQVSLGVFFAWIAYRIYRHDCFMNCDEDEIEANAMTPGRFDEPN